MINPALFKPKSIVVVGASNDISKPGGRVLKHILDGRFAGEVYAVNPKEDEIQGIRCCHNVKDLPDVDLAVIAIAAKYTPDTVEMLTKEKNTRAIIIISAGFGEESHEGKVLEDKIVASCNAVGAALIGPNCTGVLTPYHRSIFTGPMPELIRKAATSSRGAARPVSSSSKPPFRPACGSPTCSPWVIRRSWAWRRFWNIWTRRLTRRRVPVSSCSISKISAIRRSCSNMPSR